MKRIIPILLCFLIYGFAFSNDYVLLENCIVETYGGTPKYMLEKNKNINVLDVYCGNIDDEGIYFAKIANDRYVKIKNCKNLDLKTSLPDDFIAAVYGKGGSYLYPNYAIEMVYKLDRDYLYNYEEKNINTMTVDDGDWGITYWYERSVHSQLISNIALNLGSFYGLTRFLVYKIENIKKNEYLVYSNKIIYHPEGYLGQDYIYRDLFDKKEVVFKLKKDGDYLEVYVNKEKTPREVYCYVNNDFRLQILKLVHDNKCDLSNITWPRHADGSCDYDGSQKTPVVQTSDAFSSTITTSQTLSVTENLKLRSGEATSTQVLTVMAAGTKVKILETGKKETIDGITSNWVKVEVLAGAKDRDGKPIKAGTVGWCYGGYLKLLEEPKADKPANKKDEKKRRNDR